MQGLDGVETLVYSALTRVCLALLRILNLSYFPVSRSWSRWREATWSLIKEMNQNQRRTRADAISTLWRALNKL